MCLLLVAHGCCAGYRLVVAANRDEFHARPTDAAARWRDRPHVIGGRDGEAGGTWLALDEGGRFATITNVRATASPIGKPRSRGLIVTDFLDGAAAPAAFLDGLAADGTRYEGFNVLAYDGATLGWYSNQAPPPRLLEPGIYTLSNALLDTAWPKTERLREGFAHLFDSDPGHPVEALLDLLRDGMPAPEDELPDTGIGSAMERVLSSIFIEGDSYGTRCSTVILISDAGRATFHERRYAPAGEVTGESHFEFEVPPTSA
ncbi:MAG: NRDE family protein [Gammaproteobacteria bacterium]